ncbi:MAG: translation initiation factor IF-6 [Thermoplasmata archaeon]
MIQKTRVFNSPFLGVYLRTWEKYTLVPSNLDRDMSRIISESLGTELIELTLGGTKLLGSLSAMNSKGILLSNIASDEEKSKIPSDLNIAFLKDQINAVGNDILVNDKAALVHEDFDRKSLRVIEDILDVEVRKGSFGEIKTIGSCGLITTQGLILPPSMSDEEIDEMSNFFGVKGKIGTANFGSLYVGASVVANSKGALIGEDSTTIEISNIEEALNL